MTIFERNLEALNESQPVLAVELGTTPSFSAFLETTPDGGVTARSGGGQGPWVQSRRAPIQESERLLANVKPVPLQPVVILGCGMGYTMEQALQRFSQNSVMVIEHNLPLLRSVLERVDVSKSLLAHRLSFANNLPGQPVRDLFTKFVDLIAVHGFVTVNHAYTNNDPRYTDLYAELAEWMRTRSLGLRSEMTGAKNSIQNLVMNISHYLTVAGVTRFRGLLKGVPGVLVAAGPSLQRNLHVLKRFEGRCYVHVVSSALKRVKAEGLTIHSTNAVDYSSHSQRYFIGVEGERPPLWVHPRTNPLVLDGYGGPLVVCDDDFYRGIFRGEVEDHGDFDDGGSNVAHYAYNILRHLGCEPIIACGLDQSFPFYISHIPGTPINDEWIASAHRFCSLELQELQFTAAVAFDVKMREDVHGNPLPTDNLMENTALQFEDMIARHPESKFINATEGGRRLKGSIDMSLADALTQYAVAPIDLAPYHAVLKDAESAREEKLRAGLATLGRARIFGDRIASIFDEARRALNKAEKALNKRKSTEDTAQLLDRLKEQLDEWPGVYGAVRTFAQADILTRQQLDPYLNDTSVPEIDRLRLLAKREQDYIRALQKCLEIWHELLDRGTLRLEERIAEHATQVAEA